MMQTCPRCWGAGSIPDETLSRNFRLSEFLQSSTARKNQLSNVPSPEVLENLRENVRELLQPMRNALGALRVTSGIRMPDVNSAVGGSSTSVHRLGWGVDVIPVRCSVDEAIRWLASSGLGWDQAIDEGHLHLGFKSPSGAQRKQLLAKRDGKYLPWVGGSA